MKFEPVYGYETTEEAYHYAEILKKEGIECLLDRREKGFFGDPETSGLTWISVPEPDLERAQRILDPPPVDDPNLKMELQYPRCGSLKVKFDIVSHKKGPGRIFTWPWDKEQFFCENCQHVWDRHPEPE